MGFFAFNPEPIEDLLKEKKKERRLAAEKVEELAEKIADNKGDEIRFSALRLLAIKHRMDGITDDRNAVLETAVEKKLLNGPQSAISVLEKAILALQSTRQSMAELQTYEQALMEASKEGKGREELKKMGRDHENRREAILDHQQRADVAMTEALTSLRWVGLEKLVEQQQALVKEQATWVARHGAATGGFHQYVWNAGKGAHYTRNKAEYEKKIATIQAETDALKAKKDTEKKTLHGLNKQKKDVDAKLKSARDQANKTRKAYQKVRRDRKTPAAEKKKLETAYKAAGAESNRLQKLSKSLQQQIRSAGGKVRGMDHKLSRDLGRKMSRAQREKEAGEKAARTMVEREAEWKRARRDGQQLLDTMIAGERKIIEVLKTLETKSEREVPAPELVLKPEDPADKDTLEKMNLAELYRTCDRLEGTIVDQYRDLRALELAMLRGMPLSQAVRNIEAPKPKRLEIPDEELTRTPRTATGLDEQKATIKTAILEVAKMEAYCQSLLAALLADEEEVDVVLEEPPLEEEVPPETLAEMEAKEEELKKELEEQLKEVEKKVKEAEEKAKKAAREMKEAAEEAEKKVEKTEKELEKTAEEAKETKEKTEKAARELAGDEEDKKEKAEKDKKEKSVEELAKKAENAAKAMKEVAEEAEKQARKAEEAAKDSKDKKARKEAEEAKKASKELAKAAKQAEEAAKRAEETAKAAEAAEQAVAEAQTGAPGPAGPSSSTEAASTAAEAAAKAAQAAKEAEASKAAAAAKSAAEATSKAEEASKKATEAEAAKAAKSAKEAATLATEAAKAAAEAKKAMEGAVAKAKDTAQKAKEASKEMKEASDEAAEKKEKTREKLAKTSEESKETAKKADSAATELEKAKDASLEAMARTAEKAARELAEVAKEARSEAAKAKDAEKKNRDAKAKKEAREAASKAEEVAKAASEASASASAAASAARAAAAAARAAADAADDALAAAKGAGAGGESPDDEESGAAGKGDGGNSPDDLASGGKGKGGLASKLSRSRLMKEVASEGVAKAADISKLMKARDLTRKDLVKTNVDYPVITRESAGMIWGRSIKSTEGVGARWLVVDSWYVVGPWPNPKRSNRDRKFPPENKVDLDATYEGKDGRKLKWQFMQAAGGWHKTVLTPPNASEYAIYYFYTEVRSDAARDLWFATGSDDKSVVWINDMLVWESEGKEKGWGIGEGYRKVHLKKGVNRILYRLENGHKGMGMSLIFYANPDF